MIKALMSCGWVIECDCWCDTDVDDFNNNDEYGDVVVVDDDDDDDDERWWWWWWEEYDKYDG